MSFCPGCGQENLCAVSAGEVAETCWCFRLPVGMAKPAGLPVSNACYCQTCLHKLAVQPKSESGSHPKQ